MAGLIIISCVLAHVVMFLLDFFNIIDFGYFPLSRVSVSNDIFDLSTCSTLQTNSHLVSNHNNLVVIFIRMYMFIAVWLFAQINFNWADELDKAYCNEPAPFYTSDLFVFWALVIGVAVITIVVRGVGPRLRPDQFSNWTWRDILAMLGSIVIVGLYLIV